MLYIKAVLDSLASKRPVFHNEADFQHALAWEIRLMYDCNVRLERRVDIDIKKRTYIDIFVEHKGRKIAIELKYKMRAIETVFDGEPYSLLNQGAQDIGRYDVLKDLQRLEQLIRHRLADEGYLVFLTNDSSYYLSPSVDKRTVDRSFRIHEGKTVSGILAWSEDAGTGTIKGREIPIAIEGDYQLNWQPYSQLNSSASGRLKMLIIQAKPAPEPLVQALYFPEVKNTEEKSTTAPSPLPRGSAAEFNAIVKSIDAVPLSQMDLRDKLITSLHLHGYSIVPNRHLGEEKIDIWARKGPEELAIEVRYKTALLHTLYKGNTIELKNQAAQDISRYDYLKDLNKLERVVQQRPGTKGIAILITNDRNYWTASSRAFSVDEDFRLHQGRKVHGRLSWKHAGAGTNVSREEPIYLSGQYNLDWQTYLILNARKNELFQMLIVETT